MKIITKFKDYYDFYSTNFGGPDPKVVYERHLLNDLYVVEEWGVE
jgi:hypothetical protein